MALVACPEADHHRHVTLILFAAVAGGLAVWLPRWWLLALPPTAAVGAGLLMAMPGTRIDPDNPLAFLLILTEAFLAAGIVLGRRRRRPTVPAPGAPW